MPASYLPQRLGQPRAAGRATQVHDLRQARAWQGAAHASDPAREQQRGDAEKHQIGRHPHHQPRESAGPPATSGRKRAAFSPGMAQMAREANSITTPGRSVRMARRHHHQGAAPPSFRRLPSTPLQKHRAASEDVPSSSIPVRDDAPPIEKRRANARTGKQPRTCPACHRRQGIRTPPSTRTARQWRSAADAGPYGPRTAWRPARQQRHAQQHQSRPSQR